MKSIADIVNQLDIVDRKGNYLPYQLSFNGTLTRVMRPLSGTTALNTRCHTSPV
jgi:hypothetical protein